MLDGCESLTEFAVAMTPFMAEEAEKDRISNRTLINWFRAIFDKTPNLRTFNLINWPHFRRNISYWDNHMEDEEHVLDPTALATVLPVMKHAVQRIFEIHRNEYNGRLEVVALGIREHGQPLPRYFVPAEETVFRKKRYTAAEASLRQLRHEGMHTKILEYDWLRYEGQEDPSALEYPYYLESEYDLRDLEARLKDMKGKNYFRSRGMPTNGEGVDDEFTGSDTEGQEIAEDQEEPLEPRENGDASTGADGAADGADQPHDEADVEPAAA